MKEVTIKIDKAAVLDDVSLSTGYMATRNEQSNSYKRTAILSTDKDMTDLYMGECFHNVGKALKRFATTITETENHYTATLRLPGVFNDAFTGGVNTALKSYCTNYVLSRWYEITDKQRTEYYLAVAKDSMTAALRVLFHKGAPKRV